MKKQLNFESCGARELSYVETVSIEAGSWLKTLGYGVGFVCGLIISNKKN